MSKGYSTTNISEYCCRVCGQLIPHGTTHTTHPNITGTDTTNTLASVIAGEMDDEKHDAAQAELDILRAEVTRLRAECAEWKAKYEAFRLLVKRHTDGILAGLIKTEVESTRDK